MFNRFFYFLYSVSYILNQGSPPTLAMLHIESLSLIVFISVRCFCSKKREFETWILKILNLVKICADKIYFILQSLLSDIIVEEKGWFWLTDPSTLDPSTLRGMSGQVLRVKGYYDVMIHKHHCEDVYDLIDLWYFFISIFED